MQRQLNFELLRVLSILSIVVGHLGAIGPGLTNPLCYLGDVNCFVLISGYFMIAGRFKAIRFIRLAFETIFYCFAISLVFYLFDPSVGLSGLLKSLMPFGPHAYSYWFINKFLGLLLLQPFLSKLAYVMSRRQYKWLIVVLLLLNTELLQGFPFSCLFDNGWSLPWFVTLFLIGGYVRLYNPFSGVKNWGVCWLVSALVMFTAMKWFGEWFNMQYNQWFFFAKSLTMFMWVRTMTISSDSVIGKTVQFVSPNILAVYLIHSQHLMIGWLIFVGQEMAWTQSPTTHYVSWCVFGLSVLLGCVIIDKVRVKLFDKIGISAWLASISKRCDNQLVFNVQ